MTIDADLHALATSKNFAALTTLMADGQPQTQIMWVDADEGHVLINTEVHRQKAKNIARDPRVTITVWNHQNPYQYVEVRGNVTEITGGTEARSHIDSLAKRYMGVDDYPNPIVSERIIVKITPHQLHKSGF